MLISAILGVLVLTPGFLGLQHEGLVQKIDNNSKAIERENIQDRRTSDNQTRSILKNITNQISFHNDDVQYKLDRMEGVLVRIHSDIQQVLERENNQTNQTSRIVDILPNPFD